MTDKKVSALDAATTPLDGTELVPIVQGGTSKKVAQSDLAVPADGSITGAKIASAIKDAAAGTASLRTLGTSSTSAMAGDKNLATIAAPSTDVDLNSKKITSLATPTASTDAATKGFVDSANSATARGILHQASTFVETNSRHVGGNSGNTTTGIAYFTFFTAQTSLTVSQIAMSSGTTQASTVTTARMGLYTVDSSDNITLVARVASDTSLFTSSNTVYTRSFDTTGGYPSTYDIVAGTRYAVGVIVVASTAPSYSGTVASAAVMALAPRVNGAATSLTDLPTSRSTYSTTTIAVWARLS